MKVKFFELVEIGSNGKEHRTEMIQCDFEHYDRSMPPQQIITKAEPHHKEAHPEEYALFLSSKEGGDPESSLETLGDKAKKKAKKKEQND